VKRAAAAVLTVLLGVLLTATPVHAAGKDHVVTLATNGPQPTNVTIVAGDTVTFKAGDGNTFHLRSTSTNWSVSAVVTSAKSLTRAFTAAGTYRYSSTFDTLLGESPPANGSVVVPTSSPSPSASASPTAKPSSAVTSRPSASASAVPTQSGVAVPPPITGGVVPTADPTTPSGPTPQFAPQPGQTASPTAAPAANVQYADPSGLVQGSRHGYGLPTLLAVVGIVGVATLLVRLLLAQPEARPEARVDL
jgi:plastocyanin